MAVREIKKVITGVTQFDGAGVKLLRVIGYSNTRDFDPFLLLDIFDTEDPKDYIKGFPWHPHRGIETITYLLDGVIEHSDSMGNRGQITDGSCQWMTAGKAVLHQEMPQEAGKMLGMQLWLNLPRRDKLVPPKYRDIQKDRIPRPEEDGCRVGIISGTYKEIQGAATGDYIKPTILDVEMKQGVQWNIPVEPEETAFLYIIRGEGYFGGETIQKVTLGHAVLFGQGDTISVRTEEDKLRFFLFCGKPLRESIAWGGPIVMNTGDELEKAFQEIRAGSFGK